MPGNSTAGFEVWRFGVPFSGSDACAAYIASISSSGFADVDNQHLKHAVNTFNGLVSTQDTILIGSTVDSPIPQKALSFKMDTEQFRALLDSSSPANKARLLHQFKKILSFIKIREYKNIKQRLK